MLLPPGELVRGKYRILRALADGGMGTIYEARHEVLGTTVALKFLHAELTRRPGLVQRFLQEAHVSAQLGSPHIVQVIDVDQDEHGPFLVMELLHGESLQHRLDREKRLERAFAIDVAIQVLAGLEVAHAAGVVHRDLKPDNVFLTETSQGALVKLLDFGIAKLRAAAEFQRVGLTRPGVVMGTPEYMAPEQAMSAAEVDPRADVYALGVMLYEMLTGHRPASGDEPRAIATVVMAGHVRPVQSLDPTIPPRLAEVVHRAMAPRPEQRFASAPEMARALLPFATLLSAAGHAAAALVTGGTPSWVPPQSRVSDPPRNVPKTLPPEDPAFASTAPREPMSQAFAPPAGPSWQPDHRTYPSPGPPPAGPVSSYGPPSAYGSPTHPPAVTGQPSMLGPLPPPRGRRGPSAVFVAILAAVAGGLLVALVLAVRTGSSEPAEPPPQPTPPPTTPATTASVTTTTPPPPITQTTAPPPLPPPNVGPPHPPPSTHPPPRDGGVPEAGVDAGAHGFPPFPDLFDAGLPPIPSTFPTSITIPLPGLPAPNGP